MSDFLFNLQCSIPRSLLHLFGIEITENRGHKLCQVLNLECYQIEIPNPSCRIHQEERPDLGFADLQSTSTQIAITQ